MSQKERKYKAKFLLLGFNSESNSIKLGENLIIRRGKKTELKEMHDRIKQGSVKTQHFLLEFEYISKNPSTFSKDAYALMDDLNAFFQIFFNGIIKVAHFNKYGWIENKYHSIGFSTNTRVSTYFSKDYLLKKNEVGSLKRKWKSFQLQSEKKALRIAINRFLLSTQKYDDEDRLVDLMIAFEATFLDVTEKGELSFKLGLRSSYLLKHDFKSADVFEFVKKAYGLRSSIVHGANIKGNEIKFKGKKLDLRSVVSTLTDLIRTSYQIVIIERKESNMSDFIKTLDLEIIDGFN